MRNKNHIRLPFSDKILRTVAYILTIFWIAFLFFPIYWMLISSLKDSSEMYRDPPSFVPTIPNRYTFVMDYTPEQWEEIGGQEGFAHDAHIITWQAFGTVDANIGRIEVLARVGGELTCSAQLTRASNTINRPNIWTKSILRTDDILRSMKRLMREDYVVFETEGLSLSEDRWTNESSEKMYAQFSQEPELYGTLDEVGVTSSWANLFDSYIIAWQYPASIGMENGLAQPVANTLYMAFMSIVLSCLAASLAAYALSRFMPKRIRGVLLMIILASGMIPSTVTMIPTYQILETLELTNTFWGVILPGVCNFTAVVLFKGTFDALEASMLEAARMDGAGEVRIFFQFALPTAKGVFGVLALFGFTGAWNNFFWPMLILRDQSKFNVAMVVNVLINGTGTQPDYSMILALGFLISIPTLLVYALFQKTLTYGFDYSGLKG